MTEFMFCLLHYHLKWMWVEKEFRNNVSKHTCVSHTLNICTSVFHSIQQCHSRLWFCQCQIMSVCFTFSCWSNRCGLMFVKCTLYIWLLEVQRQLRANVLTETRAKHLRSVSNIGIVFKGSRLLLLYTLAGLCDKEFIARLTLDWLMQCLDV